MVREGAGHWPHVAQPEAVAAHLDRFFKRIIPAAPLGGGTGAFANRSADDFAAAFVDDVVLEATVLARPIEGREAVMRVMVASSQIYESLEFHT